MKITACFLHVNVVDRLSSLFLCLAHDLSKASLAVVAAVAAAAVAAVAVFAVAVVRSQCSRTLSR